MSTEQEKNERLKTVMNIAMYGLIEGLWDLFGEASFATVHSISDRILQSLESEIGKKINGGDPEAIINEVTDVLVGSFGVMESGVAKLDGDKASIACTGCFLQQATGWLEAEGVEPFACIPMNVTAAVMRKQLDKKHHILGRDWDEATKTCTINFELI
ncbi:MAG: hypothetical protein ABFS17_06190 [Chloroflexota bacterium]